MMQKKALNYCISLFFWCSVTPVMAADLFIGDPKSDLGELKLSGFLRAKYQDKSWTDNDHKLTFDAARVNLDYSSPKIFGYLEYRCYQFDKLCDFSTLVDAYVGYNINDTQLVQAGLQPVPFGPDRFWESNYYGGIITQIGLEDVHNLGLKYQGKFDTGTQVELAYFTGDGGHYSGPYSEDASRYSTNFVKPEDSSLTHLNEQNMFIGRIKQDIRGLPKHMSGNIGASYWQSDIENKTYDQTGDRQAWAIFSDVRYKDLGFGLTLGKNKVNNKDPLTPKESLMGSFDDNFMVANEGIFYTADVSYKFKNVGKLDTVMPYAMYSNYVKSENGYDNSSRHLLGVAAYYKNMSFVAEYIMGKNDFLIGGPSSSYAQGGDDKTHQLLNLQFYYNF